MFLEYIHKKDTWKWHSLSDFSLTKRWRKQWKISWIMCCKCRILISIFDLKYCHRSQVNKSFCGTEMWRFSYVLREKLCLNCCPILGFGSVFVSKLPRKPRYPGSSVTPGMSFYLCIVLYWIDGLFIAAQCTATFSRSLVLPRI